MIREYYYADLDLTVTLKEGQAGFLDGLNDNESLSLSNQLYLSISGFLTNRALYAAEIVACLERIKAAGKKDPDTDGGG